MNQWGPLWVPLFIPKYFMIDFITNNLTDIIGYTASVCLILGYMPQAIYTIRTHDTEGIALPTFLMMGVRVHARQLLHAAVDLQASVLRIIFGMLQRGALLGMLYDLSIFLCHYLYVGLILFLVNDAHEADGQL